MANKQTWLGSDRFSEYYLREKVDNRNSEIYPSLIFKNLYKKDKEKLLGLDYGCGKGHFSEEMIKREYHIICTDPHIKKGSLPKNITSSFVQTSSMSKRNRQLPFHANKFDYIVSISVFEHISINNLKFLLNEFKRILKPHGVILIHIPPYTPAYFWETIKKKTTGYIPVFSGNGNIFQRFFNRRDGDPSHITWFTTRRIKKFLRSQDFEIIEVLPFLLKSRMRKSEMRGVLFHTKRRIQKSLNRSCLNSSGFNLSKIAFGVLKSFFEPLCLGYTVLVTYKEGSH